MVCLCVCKKNVDVSLLITMLMSTHKANYTNQAYTEKPFDLFGPKEIHSA